MQQMLWIEIRKYVCRGCSKQMEHAIHPDKLGFGLEYPECPNGCKWVPATASRDGYVQTKSQRDLQPIAKEGHGD
jgi:hypothetical protein